MTIININIIIIIIIATNTITIGIIVITISTGRYPTTTVVIRLPAFDNPHKILRLSRTSAHRAAPHRPHQDAPATYKNPYIFASLEN